LSSAAHSAPVPCNIIPHYRNSAALSTRTVLKTFRRAH